MTVPKPRYAPSIIYTCPDCDSDLEPEGGDCYWCSSCCAAVHFSRAALYDDTDYDRD